MHYRAERTRLRGQCCEGGDAIGARGRYGHLVYGGGVDDALLCYRDQRRRDRGFGGNCFRRDKASDDGLNGRFAIRSSADDGRSHGGC